MDDAAAVGDRDGLRRSEEALQRAQLDSDVDELDRLLHPELTFVGPDGAVSGKADDLEVHRTGGMSVRVSEPEDLLVRVNDGVGVTVLTVHLAGSFRGQEFDGRMRYTRAWALGDSGWRVVAAHASFLA